MRKKFLILTLATITFFSCYLLISFLQAGNVAYAEQQQGSFIIRAKLKGPAGERFIKEDEKQYFYYDIRRVQGMGASTTSVYVLRDIQPDQVYSLPANDPSKRDEYVIDIKEKPGWNYLGYPFDYERRGGVFDLPYTFTIVAGQQTEVTIPYGVNILMISLLEHRGSPQLAPVGFKFKADIVDYKGSFVRNLTLEEAQEVAFEFEKSDCAQGPKAAFNGKPGDWEGCGQKIPGFPSPVTLGDYSHIPVSLTPQDLFRVLNVQPPQGYVLRSIGEKDEITPGESLEVESPILIGINLYRNNCVPDYVWAKYSDVLGSNPCSSRGIVTVTLHFTALGESRFQKKDAAQFLAEGDSGLDFVKRIVQTYSDKEALYTEVHDDFRAFKNLRGTRDFPAQLEIASFNQKPYLFINTGSKIQIYDISNPADPQLVENFRVPQAIDPTLDSRPPVGTASPWPIIRKMFVKDNYPYVLVNLRSPYSGVVGAILRLNPQTMKLSVDEKLKIAGSQLEAGFFIGPPYAAEDGQVYIIGRLACVGGYPSPLENSILKITPPRGFPKDARDCQRGIVAIYKLDDAGREISIVKALYYDSENSGINSKLPEISLSYLPDSQFFTFSVEGRTYLLVAGGRYFDETTRQYISPKKIKLIDITNPTNIPSELLVSPELAQPASLYHYVIDETKKRMYVVLRALVPSSALKIEVFDLSKLPSSLEKITEFSSILQMAGISEQSPAIVELKKRLNIPLSKNILVPLTGRSVYAPTFSVKNGVLTLFLPWSWFRLTENDEQINTEYSDYMAPFMQFFVDGGDDFRQPKLLGVILGRGILKIAEGKWVEVSPDYCSYFEDLRSFAIIYRNRYIYRANCRIADVWEFKNRRAITDTLPSNLPSSPDLSKLKSAYEQVIGSLKRRGYNTSYLESFFRRLFYGN